MFDHVICKTGKAFKGLSLSCSGEWRKLLGHLYIVLHLFMHDVSSGRIPASYIQFYAKKFMIALQCTR